MKKEDHVGSNLPDVPKEGPLHITGSEKMFGSAENSLALGAGSFTTYWTWRANGVFHPVTFYHSAINANSRVFVSISEFNSDAAINRFIGLARMAVYNVAPFNGGFNAWVEISWGNPINARFDVLIDP